MAQLFQMFPWRGGGLNTSLDPAQIAANELTAADHIQYGPTGSQQKREGINFDFDDQTSGTDDIIGGADFWYGDSSSRTQKYVVVTEAGAIYAYTPSTGARSADLFAGTAWGTAPTRACLVVLNNLLLIFVDGNNTPKKYDGTTVSDLGGTPPNLEWAFEHEGRILGRAPNEPDRLHYSPPNDPETWNGTGDSGAIDIRKGDGDSLGLTGGFSFLSTAYVGKRNRLYKLDGDFPDVAVRTRSNKLGIESHASIVVMDDSDVVWCSGRGFHSLSATDQFGDLKSAFLSAKIQLDFNENFTRSRLKYVKGIYVEALNSVAWAVTNEEFGSKNNCLYFWNPEDGWYRWPDLSCQALFTAEDTDVKRFYLGTETGRLAKAQTGSLSDTNESGTEVAIERDTASGRISIDGSLVTDKRFTGFWLIYRPDGSHTITVDFRVDGQAPQSLAYTDTTGAALLGVDFTLGVDLLGSTLPVDAYGFGVDGIGSTFSVRVRQSGTDEQGDVLGFAVSYEPAGHSHEVLERAD